MDAETRKTIYWVLHNVRDEELHACLECTDFDCSRNSINDYIKKKHRVDVIDKRDCLKKKRAFALKLRRILEMPLFRKENSISCDKCGKKFKRTQHPWPLCMHVEKISGERNYSIQRICRSCRNKTKKHAPDSIIRS